MDPETTLLIASGSCVAPRLYVIAIRKPQIASNLAYFSLCGDHPIELRLPTPHAKSTTKLARNDTCLDGVKINYDININRFKLDLMVWNAKTLMAKQENYASKRGLIAFATEPDRLGFMRIKRIWPCDSRPRSPKCGLIGRANKHKTFRVLLAQNGLPHSHVKLLVTASVHAARSGSCPRKLSAPMASHAKLWMQEKKRSENGTHFCVQNRTEMRARIFLSRPLVHTHTHWIL